MREKLENKIYSDNEFLNIVSEIINNEHVQEMQNYRQHFSTTCYDHCLEASYYSYKVCKFLHLDYISSARAAMVHDMFLYDWRKPNPYGGLHAFTHGKISYENASKYFEFNKKEKDIITKHMWPVCIGIPRYIESYILTLVDKYCTMLEAIDDITHDFSAKKLLKHAYIFLAFILFKRR